MNTNTEKTPEKESKWAALARPFPTEHVQVKVLATNQDKSRGLIVPFINARAVMDRLDQVVGPDGWSDAYDVIAVGVVKCRLTISGITKTDVGQGDDAKSAFSDSLKRAAVRWGIGRYLYDAVKLWGPLDSRGQISDPEQAKLRVLGMKTSQKRATERAPQPLRSSDELIHPNGDLPF
ncbi:MAG: hypothetical protein ACI9BV_003902 [Rhodothermales bacterium]|jgi:hypothetical protein